MQRLLGCTRVNAPQTASAQARRGTSSRQWGLHRPPQDAHYGLHRLAHALQVSAFPHRVTASIRRYTKRSSSEGRGSEYVVIGIIAV